MKTKKVEPPKFKFIIIKSIERIYCRKGQPPIDGAVGDIEVTQIYLVGQHCNVNECRHDCYDSEPLYIHLLNDTNPCFIQNGCYIFIHKHQT